MKTEEELKAQKKRATNFKIQSVLGKLNMQWSLKEDGHCLHGDWISLANAVGLSQSDVPQLKLWVAQNGKKEPMRKKVVLKNNATQV